MPSNVFQNNTPPPSGQSQVGGWTVLQGPEPTPTNDSDSSVSDEEDIIPPRKRKAGSLISSSRPAKSPRVSGGGIAAGATPPFTQSSTSSLIAKINASASQPNTNKIHLSPHKRNFPPIKSLASTGLLKGSKSVPSSSQRIASSQSVLKSKLVDGTRSSSSDSLPDPIALVSKYGNAPGKQKSNDAGGKGKERAIDSSVSTHKGSRSSGASSSVSKSKNPSANQKRVLSKPRFSVRGMDTDDETIVISSDSDDRPRAASSNSTGRQRSQKTKRKVTGSNVYLTNSDGAIDLTSDTGMGTVAESQLVNGSLAKSRENRKPYQEQSSTHDGAEAASSTPSTATLPSGTSLQGHIYNRIFQETTARPGGASTPLSRSAPVPWNSGPSGSGVSSTQPVDTGSTISSSHTTSSSMGGSKLKLSQAWPRRPRSSLPAKFGNKHAPPADAEIIDLCDDSDMEVDSLLAANPNPPDAQTPSAAVHLENDGQHNVNSPDAQHRPELLLPRISQPPHHDMPRLSPSSPSANEFQPTNESSTSAVSKLEREPVEDMASIPESPTFGEASLLIDAVFNHEPSDTAPSIIDDDTQAMPVPSSSSVTEDPILPSSAIEDPMLSSSNAEDFMPSSSAAEDPMPSSSAAEDPMPSSLPVVFRPLSCEPSNIDALPMGAISKDDGGETSEWREMKTSYVTVENIPLEQNVDPDPSMLPAAFKEPLVTLSDGSVGTNTPDGTTETLQSYSLEEKLAQDPTEVLVPPVSGMRLQSHVNAVWRESPDKLDVFMQDVDIMDVDDVGSRPLSPATNRASGSCSPFGRLTGESSESSVQSIQYARKMTGKPPETDESESGLRSDVSEKDNTETQEQEDAAPAASPSRPVISVKEPDFSKLRADIPTALEDAGGLSDAIQWPAEKIPTELHDMLNSLPANYHRNPQMKYIFESMMEENTADDEPTSPRIELYSGQNGPVCPPWEFYYTNRVFYGKGVPRSDKKLLKGCDCDGPCDPSSKTCACVQRQMAWTGDDKSIKGFLYNKKGKILNPGYPIFECNEGCECSEDCMNRVIQNGRQHQISICLTKGKGWGVYADEKIPRGTYLGIYSGEMLLESEAAERGKLYDKYGRTYLFDLDFYYLHSLEADKQKTSASKSDEAPSTSQRSAGDKDEERSNLYTIDAFHVGNFTRFLNHSCDPNCVITPSYVNEPDLQKPTLTIFTTRDVKKGDELCFSYFGNDDDEDDEDQVDEHGQTKKVVGGPGTHTTKAIHRPCLCKAANCRGKMF